MHILAFLFFAGLLSGALALISTTLSANAGKIGAALRGMESVGPVMARRVPANEDEVAVLVLAA